MRLHISPLSPDLLTAVVGPHLLDSVSNLSYHSIQTFPENSYGYLDLPTMEAEKIKKKLNGAILKGKKIRVEEARPQKRRRVEEAVEVPPGDQSSITTAKKSKKERNVILGHELPSGRKVRRGWTEAKSTKSSRKGKEKTRPSTSKYADKDELLFRTKLPPNMADPVGTTKKEKSKSKKKKNGDYMVHEFEKSTSQPSFLKQDVGLGIKGNLKYVEGQGWVNDNDEVVEKESERVLRQREAVKPLAEPRRKVVNPPEPSTDDFKSVSDEQDDDETSSSGSSSDSESSEEAASSASSKASVGDREHSGQPDVHPLEAIFKKPKKPASQDIAKPSLEIATSFSFFESGTPDDDIDEEPNIPGTPFSSQDIRSRGLRSAAPTPDTAHPSRFNSYGSSGLPGDEDFEEDDDEHDGDATVESDRSKRDSRLGETPAPKRSEFEAKFWESRGENNRAWKSRRKTVLKEKRQRENKARRPKNW